MSTTSSTTAAGPRHAVAIVDPYECGAVLAALARRPLGIDAAAAAAAAAGGGGGGGAGAGGGGGGQERALVRINSRKRSVSSNVSLHFSATICCALAEDVGGRGGRHAAATAARRGLMSMMKGDEEENDVAGGGEGKKESASAGGDVQDAGGRTSSYRSIRRAAHALKALSWEVVAVLAGNEQVTWLADALAAALGLQCTNVRFWRRRGGVADVWKLYREIGAAPCLPAQDAGQAALTENEAASCDVLGGILVPRTVFLDPQALTDRGLEEVIEGLEFAGPYLARLSDTTMPFPTRFARDKAQLLLQARRLLRQARYLGVVPRAARRSEEAGDDSTGVDPHVPHDDRLDHVQPAPHGHAPASCVAPVRLVLQRVIDGLEYIVDTFSREGRHKVTAVWRMHRTFIGAGRSEAEASDRFSGHDGRYVVHSMYLADPRGEKAMAAVQCALRMLERVGMWYGATTSTVIVFKSGVLASTSGGEQASPARSLSACHIRFRNFFHWRGGAWSTIAEECIGYTHMGLACDHTVGGQALQFDRIPDVPTLRAYGGELHLVARQSGIVRSSPAFERIKAFASYKTSLNMPERGVFVRRSGTGVNDRSSIVHLVSRNSKQFLAEFRNSMRHIRTRPYDLAVHTQRRARGMGICVIVDPFSTGEVLTKCAAKIGLTPMDMFTLPQDQLVRVATGAESGPFSDSPEKVAAFYRARCRELRNTLARTPVPVFAILPGAELGVPIADMLSEEMGTRGNPSRSSALRRDKYLMTEALHRAGIPAARQTKGASWRAVRDVVMSWFHDEAGAAEQKDNDSGSTPTPFRVVVKPLNSCGTDGVTLCTSVAEVEAVFSEQIGKNNMCCVQNKELIVMEELRGIEYVVDAVSRDGEHKTTAIWQYDKRPANGCAYVYFSMRLRDGHAPGMDALVNYHNQMLDALEVQNGATHSEIIVTEDRGPILVEMGARCHGAGGSWMPVTKACVGYSQVEATISAMVDVETFDRLPQRGRIYRYGAEVFLVSRRRGKVSAVPGMTMARNLSSFKDLNMKVGRGSPISATNNIATRPGSVLLVNSKEEQLLKDMQTLLDMQERDAFFEVEEFTAEEIAKQEAAAAAQRNASPEELAEMLSELANAGGGGAGGVAGRHTRSAGPAPPGVGAPLGPMPTAAHSISGRVKGIASEIDMTPSLARALHAIATGSLGREDAKGNVEQFDGDTQRRAIMLMAEAQIHNSVPELAELAASTGALGRLPSGPGVGAMAAPPGAPPGAAAAAESNLPPSTVNERGERQLVPIPDHLKGPGYIKIRGLLSNVTFAGEENRPTSLTDMELDDVDDL